MWRIVETIIDVERYRPQLEDALAEATGLPVAIAELDLAWRPIPCLSAEAVAIGGGDFAATAERIDVFPSLRALLSRRVRIPRIVLEGLVVTLPLDAEAARSRWDDTWLNLERAFAGSGEAAPEDAAWGVEVASVRAPDASLRLGGEAEPLLAARLVARGIDSDALALEIAAELVASGAHVEGTLHWPLASAGEQLRGDFRVERLRPHRLADLPSVLETVWSGRLDLTRGEDAALRLDFAGEFAPESEGALAGSYSGRARVTAEAATAELRVESERGALDAALALREGALEIAELRAGPLVLSGRIRPEGAGRVDLALSGRVALEDAWLHALGAPESLRDTRGTLEIEVLAGSFPPGPDREPIRVRARMEGGGLRFAVGDGEDAISDLSLRIRHRDRRIEVAGRARSQRLGAVELDATLDPDARSARGQAGFDAARLAAFVRDVATRARVVPIFERYGASRVAFRIAPLRERDGAYRVSLQRAEEPRIDATATLRTAGGEAPLGDLDLEAELPADALGGLLPEGSRASGLARVALRRRAAEASFSTELDLASLGFASGRFVEKKPGEALTLRIEGGGRESGDDWAPRRLELVSEAGRAAGSLEDGHLVARDLALDLAHWSFLLVDGARASGRLRVDYDGRVPSAELALEGVALRLSDELGADAIDGAVLLRGDEWEVRDLRIRGAGSDATLRAARSGGRVEGELRGANLDVDFVRALLDEVAALRPDGAPDEPSPPVSGTLAVNLERMGYGRSEARAVRAAITLRDGGVEVRDLALDTYEGHVSGTIDVRSRDGDAPRLALALDVENVTGRFLDEAFFASPRGIQGRFSAKLRFDAPLQGDFRAMMAAADGTLAASGSEGSFGRLGLATKLITVIRSTEALRAKMPSMKDEGLVFDTATAKLAMEQGHMTLESLDIDAKSYAIDARGDLDFRKEESKVPIEVNAIRGLVGVVEWIPVAGRALEIVNVRLVATGSPYDLQVGVASFTDQLLGAGRAGAGVVVENASDALRILRGAVGGGAKEAAEPGPAAETREPAPDATATGAPDPEPSSDPEPEAAPAPAPEAAPSDDPTTASPPDGGDPGAEPARDLPDPPAS